MKLTEVMVMPNKQLSRSQLQCLVVIFMSDGVSEEGAAKQLQGNDNLIAAAEYLLGAGHIANFNGGLAITKSGMNELQNAGMVENGQLSDEAKALIGQPASGSDEVAN